MPCRPRTPMRCSRQSSALTRRSARSSSSWSRARTQIPSSSKKVCALGESLLDDEILALDVPQLLQDHGKKVRRHRGRRGRARARREHAKAVHFPELLPLGSGERRSVKACAHGLEEAAAVQHGGAMIAQPPPPWAQGLTIAPCDIPTHRAFTSWPDEHSPTPSRHRGPALSACSRWRLRLGCRRAALGEARRG